MKPGESKSIFFSEYLGRAITLYADNFSALMLFSFACAAPAVFNALLNAVGLPFVSFLLIPVIFCVHIFFLMCMTYMVVSLAMDRQVTAGEVMVYVRDRSLRGIGGYLLLTLVVLLGFMLLILPGIFCFTVGYFFIFVILLEDMGVVAAFKRSYALVSPCFWKVLGAHGLVFLLTGVLLLPFFVGMTMMGFDREIVMPFIGVVAALSMPAFVAFYYFIYTDLKAGLDGVMNISVHD